MGSGQKLKLLLKKPLQRGATVNRRSAGPKELWMSRAIHREMDGHAAIAGSIADAVATATSIATNPFCETDNPSFYACHIIGYYFLDFRGHTSIIL